MFGESPFLCLLSLLNEISQKNFAFQQQAILTLLTLLPTAFYDFLSYGDGIFIPHPRKQC